MSSRRPTMGAIRHHKKTRTGCMTCRKRRVKCDEASPICENCWKRDVLCTWADRNKRPQLDSASPTSPSTRSSPASGNPLHPNLGQVSVMSANSSVSLDFATLEVMHHYTNVVAESLHDYEPDASQVWKTVVPSLAFNSQAKPLLHAMLAVSSLHLSTLYPRGPLSTKYAILATHQFDQATKVFVAHPFEAAHGAVHTENLGINFVTNLLIVFYSLASASSIHSPEWVRLLRSRLSREELNEAWRHYVSGAVAPLALNLAAKFHHINNLVNSQPALFASYPFPECLSVIHLPHAGIPDPSEVMDPDVSEMYKGAVNDLKRVWVASWQPGCTHQATLGFFGMAPTHFIKLLWARRPRALVILAHYCHFMMRMGRMRPLPWWIRLHWHVELEDIRRELGPAWRDWLPSEEMVDAAQRPSHSKIQIQAPRSDYNFTSWVEHCPQDNLAPVPTALY